MDDLLRPRALSIFRVGRIDLSYASEEDLKVSLQKLAKLPPETVVLLRPRLRDHDRSKNATEIKEKPTWFNQAG